MKTFFMNCKTQILHACCITRSMKPFNVLITHKYKSLAETKKKKQKKQKGWKMLTIKSSSESFVPRKHLLSLGGVESGELFGPSFVACY